MLLTAVTLSLAVAGPVAPAAFQDLHWRLLGPFRGGRVLTVSGVPGEPDHFYFGSVNGGVWESTDAGRTWTPIFDAQPIGSIGALAVAPSDAKRLYVGTGEADMRSDIAQGDGVYVSSDGGRSWLHVGLEATQQIGRILVDPRDRNRVFVAALGHPYGPNPERGVFRSSDGGRTWSKVLYKDENTGAIDLAFKPGDPSTLYAALWQTRRPPWSVYPPSNGPGSGIYKSTDGGTTWTPLGGHGFPAAHGRVGFGVSPSAPDRLYAIVDAVEGGLYRSDDAGSSWTRTSADTRIWDRGWYFGRVTVDPRDADLVYAGNTALYLSRDGGRTFVPTKGAPGGDDYHELWIDAEQPARRILGVDQGAVVSLNGGDTWSSWYNQPTAQMYHVVTDDRFPYWVYGAQQDSGAAGVPSRTATQDGITMAEFREVTAGGESDMIAPDPKDPDVIYGGRVHRLDLRTQQTQTIDPTLLFRDVERATWTLPIVFSRRDPRVLYFARERLFRTDDGGQRWTTISPDLTREDPGVPGNLDAATAADAPRRGRRHGVIYSIAPSRVADRDLWLGTDDGQIWRTRDEGGHWQSVTPPALTPWSKVGTVEASHFDADSAYAAIDRHRLDDARPYVYRTHDGGRSWTLAAGGIPAGSFVNAVREDPVRRGLLYAGTEKGVYVSFDDGDHWQPLQLSLPVSSVRDLEVHGNDLVIATHGRSFWVLDDVTPLRQLEPEVADRAIVLFAPATAVRLRPAGFAGTPLPKDEPLAANPPAGAFIDYYLKATLGGPLTLSIYDEQGSLVRSYASDTPVKDANLVELHVAPEWVTRPARLLAGAGMHRFVWPIRYAAPTSLAGDDAEQGVIEADGIWAPPGRYTVELRAGAERLTQPLTIAPDPRVLLPADAYRRQFEFARKIEAPAARVAAAAAEAEKLLPTLTDPATRALGDALLGPRWGALPASAPPNGVKSLRALAGTLRQFAAAADTSDAAPTPDAEAGFASLVPAIDATLAEWDALKTKVSHDPQPGMRR